jgi:hypothetical protein
LPVRKNDDEPSMKSLSRPPLSRPSITAIVLAIAGSLTILFAGLMLFGGKVGNSTGALTVFFLIVSGAVLFAFAKVISLLQSIRAELGLLSREKCPVPGPSLSPTDLMFFYQVNSEIRGPVSLMDLGSMRAAPSPGSISGDTMVCAQGTREWLRLADVVKR